jgi:sulfate/thiosulfate transport system ATP-binding protein
MPAMLPLGKRHRLALARALAAEPRLLLVGEGFGLGDPGRPPTPRRWLRDLQGRLGMATLVVSHGPEEALALGDRIAVLNAGRLEQVGTPAELRRRPATAFVAETLRDGAAAPWVEAMAQGGVVPEGRPPGGPVPPPGALEAVDAGGGTPARVLGATALGATLRLELQLLSDGRQVEAEVPSPGLATQLPPGTIIGLRLRGGRVACSEGGPPSRYGIRRHDPAGGSPL